jgi:hypothetical protein
MTEPQPSSRAENRLIAASKVDGTNVFNTHGEKLGALEDVMIDKPSGRIAYAVLSFGGFLGIGGHHHPLPWSTLRYDTGLGGYVVDLDPRVLEGAPAYAAEDEVAWEDEAWGRKIHDYYDTEPYWRAFP